MKGIICCAILLFMYLSGRGQNLDITYPVKSADTIYASTHNRLYIYDYTEGNTCEGVQVSCQKADIIRGESCVVYLKPKVPSGYIDLILTKGSEKQKVSLYVTDKILLPSVSIYNANQDEVLLRHIDSLVCRSAGQNGVTEPIRFKVIFFVAELESKGNIIHKEINHSNRFTTEFYKNYLRCYEGDKIKLKNIVVADDMNNTYSVPDITHTMGGLKN